MAQFTLRDLSDRFQMCSESQSPLSAIYHQFQLNVLTFTSTIVSGSAPTTVKGALQSLRDTGAERHQQWQILYTAIKDLNTELAEKRKVITCLAYRHALEKLPNESSAAWRNVWTRHGQPNGATGKWKAMWELAVEKELLRMVHEYNGLPAATVPPPTGAGPVMTTVARGAGRGAGRGRGAPPVTGGTATTTAPLTTGGGASAAPKIITASAAPTITAPLTTGGGVTTAPTTTIGAAATAPTTTAPTASGGGVTAAPALPAIGPQSQRLEPLLRNDFNFFVNSWTRRRGHPHPNLTMGDLGIWTDWPSFARGMILYSSLSGDIHTFGSAYDVEGGSWLSSDRVILAWLKPRGPLDTETEEVIWADEWTNQKDFPL